MPSAFGLAMLNALNHPNETFQLSLNDGPLMPQRCNAFLTLRQEEVDLFNGISLPERARVLDYGCGTGRHLVHLRTGRADIHCVGIEVCDGLRTHCAGAVSEPAKFFAHWHQAKEMGPFELILLMGNGLGVLGKEQEARTQLRELVRSMAPGGRIVIETGNWNGRGYRTDTLEIRYQGHVDGPFPWGGADRTWVTDELQALGADVTLSRSWAPGGFLFFAIASLAA